MSDLKRYYIGVYDGEAQARACGMGVNEIIRDSDGEIFILASDCDRVTAERDGLQLSLSTADQTIDDLNAAISRRTHRVRELEAQLAYAVDALNEVVKASAMYEKPFEIATLAIGEISAMADQPAPVAVVMPERLAQILKFLEGAENLDGYWFGEPGPHGSKVWWRAELRKALTETNLFAKQQ